MKKVITVITVILLGSFSMSALADVYKLKCNYIFLPNIPGLSTGEDILTIDTVARTINGYSDSNSYMTDEYIFYWKDYRISRMDGSITGTSSGGRTIQGRCIKFTQAF